jgi:hypothetical protein
LSDDPTTSTAPPGARLGARRHRDLDLGLAAVALLVPLLVSLVHAWTSPWVPTSDDALIELRSLDVPSHLPLVGVYSRYKFHHPGPVLFLVDAGPVHLFGPRGLFLASAIVNGLALVGTVWLLRRRGGRLLLVLGTITLLVLMRALADQLLDPWNPWITTLPFLLFVVAIWSVTCRDWRALPVAAVAGSFVVQAHLAFALMVALLLGPALVFAVVAKLRHRAGASWLILGVTVAVLVAMWILPLAEQVTHDPGNIALIAQSVQDPTEPPAGGEQAGDVVTHAWGTSAPWITGQEAVEPFSGRVSGAPWWTLLPTIAVVVGALALSFGAASRRRADVRDAQRGLAVVLATCAIGVVSIVRITGNALPYLVRWTWPLGALLWLLSGWLLVCSIRARRSVDRDAASAPDPRTKVLVGIGAAVIVVASALTAVAGARAPLPDEGHGQVALAVVDSAIDQLRTAGPILVRREGTDYGEIMQGVYAELERRGLPVYLLPDDAFLVGQHRVLPDGSPHATLYVVTTDGVAARLASGQAPLAAHDLLTPQERAEYDALQRRGQQQYLELIKGVTPTDPLSPAERARLDEMTPRADRALLYLVPAAPA